MPPASPFARFTVDLCTRGFRARAPRFIVAHVTAAALVLGTIGWSHGTARGEGDQVESARKPAFCGCGHKQSAARCCCGQPARAVVKSGCCGPSKPAAPSAKSADGPRTDVLSVSCSCDDLPAPDYVASVQPRIVAPASPVIRLERGVPHVTLHLSLDSAGLIPPETPPPR